MAVRRIAARALIAIIVPFVFVAAAGCSHAALSPIVENIGGAQSVKPDLDRGPASFYVSLPSLGVIDQVDPATGEIFNSFFGPSVSLMLADTVRPRVFGIDGDNIAVIGTVFQRGVFTIPLPEAVVSWGLNSPAGRLYVAGVQTVYVISTDSLKIIATVAMPSPIGSIAVAPKRGKVFVAMPAIDRIGVIDTPADVLEKRPIFEGACDSQQCQAIGVAASPDGRYVVAVSRRHEVSIGIDAATNAIVSKTQLPCSNYNPRFIGQNDAMGLAWLDSCNHRTRFVPISLQPPFSVVSFGDDFQGRRVPIQAAFDPSGAGYAIGVCESYCRGSFLLSISTTNTVVELGEFPATPGGIAYAPKLSR